MLFKGFPLIIAHSGTNTSIQQEDADINDPFASIPTLTFVWMDKHSMCHHSILSLMDLHEIWFHASYRGPHVTDKSTSDKTKGHHAAKLWSHPVSKSFMKYNNITLLTYNTFL